MPRHPELVEVSLGASVQISFDEAVRGLSGRSDGGGPVDLTGLHDRDGISEIGVVEEELRTCSCSEGLWSLLSAIGNEQEPT